MIKATHIYKATLSRAIDGDTMVVIIDLRFDVYIHVRLRLVGVNAPEISTSAGKAARARLLSFLAESQNEFLVDIEKKDRYGRWLGEVWLMRDGQQISLNKLLNENVV